MAALAGTTTSANWAGAYPYDHTVAGHDATGASALLLVASSAGAYSWDPKAYYAGVEMTLLARATSSGGQGTLWLFGLNAPAAGVNAARVVRRAASDGGTSASSEYGDLGVTTVISLTGTDPASPFGPADADYGNASVATDLVTTVADCLLVGVAHNHYASSNPIIASGATALFTNGTNANHRQSGFTKAAATPGPYSQTFSTAFNSIGAVLAAIKPAGGGGQEPVPQSYTLAAEAGSFAHTGQAAGLRAQRHLVASAGSLVHAGQAAMLKAGRRLEAEAGAVLLTGQDAGAVRDYRMDAAAGGFLLAGQEPGLRADRRLAAGPGAFALGGQDATLTHGVLASYTLAAEPGTFTLTGQDAGRLRSYRMPAEPGAFALEGQDVLFAVQALNHYVMAAEPGAYLLTGLPAADPPATAPYGRVFTGNAATSFAQTATALKSGMPFSISLWAKTGDLAQSGAVLAFMGRAESDTAYFALSLNGDKLRIEARAGATIRSVDTTNAISAGTPFHVLGVFAASTDRRAYLNGDDAGKAAGSGSASPLPATRFALGARRKLTPDGGFAGSIAHVAVWGTTLGAAEAAALAAGAWPPDVAPGSLLAFYPLSGDDPEADRQGLAPDLVLTGAAVGTFVPPVTMPDGEGENPPPVVDGEVTVATSLGAYYLWSNIAGSWDDLPAAKPWDGSAPSAYTATVARSLGFTAARPKTVERLVARPLALVEGAARSASKVVARALSFAETVTDLVDWTNLVSEAVAFTLLRPKTIQPAATAEHLAFGTARRSETSKALAEAVRFVRATSRQASFERRHLRNLAVAGTSSREFQLTLAQTLTLAELTLDNAGVILHDLVVRGQPMSLAEFRAFVARGPLGYTAKETLVPGDYRYREAIVGVSVRAAATGGISGILGLTLHVDVPDVRDRGEATLPAAASQVVPFGKTFHVPPEVYTQTRAGAVPFYADIESVSTTGMTVTLRQVSAPSTIVAGTITWSATGW